MTDRLAAIRDELRALEVDLAARLDTDRSRSRGEVVRAMHEVRRMLGGTDYPYASQAGQDRVVDRALGGRRGGTFVDVGGYNGVTGSNTLFFEQYRGWTGVLVEPVSAMRAAAETVRRCPCLPYAVAAGSGEATFVEVAEGFRQMSGLADSYDTDTLARVRADPRHRERTIRVETRDLGAILGDAGLTAPDFVSLDIEGGEVAALETFDFTRFAVRFWAIENNGGGPRIGEIMRDTGHDLIEFCGADELWRRRDTSA